AEVDVHVNPVACGTVDRGQSVAARGHVGDKGAVDPHGEARKVGGSAGACVEADLEAGLSVARVEALLRPAEGSLREVVRDDEAEALPGGFPSVRDACLEPHPDLVD